jgi:hypothetical protein
VVLPTGAEYQSGSSIHDRLKPLILEGRQCDEYRIALVEARQKKTTQQATVNSSSARTDK